MIPREYFVEAEQVVAHGSRVSYETLGEWRAELRASGTKRGMETDPYCALCEEQISSRRHILLKGQLVREDPLDVRLHELQGVHLDELQERPDTRMHTKCYRKEVEMVARVLFRKGRRSLSGKYRGEE